jgi:hypothetical protein
MSKRCPGLPLRQSAPSGLLDSMLSRLAVPTLIVHSIAGCQPHPAPEINFAPGTSITVAQNYQAAYAKALEFAHGCYGDAERHGVTAQLDTEWRQGEIAVAVKSSQGLSPVLAVSIAHRDDQSSSITTRFLDTAMGITRAEL